MMGDVPNGHGFAQHRQSKATRFRQVPCTRRLVGFCGHERSGAMELKPVGTSDGAEPGPQAPQARDNSSSEGPSTQRATAGSSFGPVVPKVSQPVGGGSIRGMGERVDANPANGSSRIELPLLLPEGRGALAPT